MGTSRAKARAVLMDLAVAGYRGAPRAWAGERGHRRRPAAPTLACGSSGGALPPPCLHDDGHLALYSFEPADDAVLILAIRHQRELGHGDESIA